MKAIGSYMTADGITVNVYPEKKVKRNPYLSFGGSYALLGALAKRGIPDDSMFAMPTRRRIK